MIVEVDVATVAVAAHRLARLRYHGAVHSASLL